MGRFGSFRATGGWAGPLAVLLTGLLPALILGVALAGETAAPVKPPPQPLPEYQASSNCRICHERIYEQHQASQHARSFTDPVFQAQYFLRVVPPALADPALAKEANRCVACHSPLTFIKAKWQQGPIREFDPSLAGVVCDFCHRVGAYKDERPGGGNFMSSPGDEEVRSVQAVLGLAPRLPRAPDQERALRHLPRGCEPRTACRSRRPGRSGRRALRGERNPVPGLPHEPQGLPHRGAAGLRFGPGRGAGRRPLPGPLDLVHAPFPWPPRGCGDGGGDRAADRLRPGARRAGRGDRGPRRGQEPPGRAFDPHRQRRSAASLAGGRRGGRRRFHAARRGACRPGVPYDVAGAGPSDAAVLGGDVPAGSRLYRAIYVDAAGAQTLASSSATAIPFDNRLRAREAAAGTLSLPGAGRRRRAGHHRRSRLLPRLPGVFRALARGCRMRPRS